jgi:hypothetical protein
VKPYTFKLGNTRTAHAVADLGRKIWPYVPWDDLLDGLGFKVTFEKIVAHQTDSQRSKYWATLNEWGDALGYTRKETETWLHNAVLCECFGVKETRVVRGMPIEIPELRSSRLNREEYSRLIETVLMLSAPDADAMAAEDAA